MSAPSKITAIRHAVSALHAAADDGAGTRRYAEALQEAAEAIDALVAADEDYDQARDRWLRVPGDHRSFEEAREAWARRAAALARIKGGAA
ncbi:hypothetical protein [uncultured Stenotrophomonas sp.]|uniref:hypothetical protein n=1 Tax=uncultured Stenotrophomonas sp. TaxID=165438 RepID=UPI0025DEC2AC|nr:hypothetical protein [uncultured Stenotrophomonas sp.]